MQALNRERARTIEELRSAALKEGEEEQLVIEKDLLKRAVQIRDKAYERVSNTILPVGEHHARSWQKSTAQSRGWPLQTLP